PVLDLRRPLRLRGRDRNGNGGGERGDQHRDDQRKSALTHVGSQRSHTRCHCSASQRSTTLPSASVTSTRTPRGRLVCSSGANLCMSGSGQRSLHWPFGASCNTRKLATPPASTYAAGSFVVTLSRRGQYSTSMRPSRSR